MSARRRPRKAPLGRLDSRHWSDRRASTEVADQLLAEVTAYLQGIPSGAGHTPGKGGPPTGVVLLPYGQSAAATCALRAVVDIFGALPVRVRVLHVRERAFTRAGPVDRETDDQAQRFLDEAVAQLRCHGVTASGVVRTGWRETIARTILAEADHSNASLIVLGARQRHLITTIVAGSTSQLVLRATRCPVLMVRSP